MDSDISTNTNVSKQWILYAAIFAAGAVFGGQSVSIYFLSDYGLAPSVGTQSPPVARASLIATPDAGLNISPPPLYKDEQRQSNNALLEDLGLAQSTSVKTPKELGGGFFLGKDVDYVVPLDADTKDARKIMATKLQQLPGLTLGTGDKEIIVLFDPLCPECHELIRQLQSDDPIAKQVKAKLIPANFFANDKNSRLASLYMLTMNAEKKPEIALQFIKDLVAGKKPGMHPVSEIPDSIIKDYDSATMAILQSGSRVPFVIFLDKESGEYELFSGRPELSELDSAGKFK